MRPLRALERSLGILTVSTLLAAAAGCGASTTTGEPRYTIVKGNEGAAPQGGIAPDKEAEIMLVLQQREVSTRKCYQDELNVKGDRAFQGTMKVLIAVGTNQQASGVKVIGGTLNSPEVATCLTETISRFEFPKLDQPGDVQYEFMFRPAY
jgi:hypothetical protein